MTKLTDSLKRLMARQCLTTKELSEKSCVSLAHLYNIIADKSDNGKISIGILERLAIALNVSLAELMQEPGYIAIQKLREQIADKDIALFDAIITLELNDWKRNAIMRILGIDELSDSTTEASGSDSDLE